MKLILSRKGFDSGAGGVASPILPDGTLCSLPIPDARSKTRYGDVVVNTVAGAALSMGEIVHALTRGRISSRHPCHLDPDLDRLAIPRCSGWFPAFGQTGAAQSHLARLNVAPGDLFLFFGWFRQTVPGANGAALAWKRSAPHIHAMFGWMQVAEILPVHRRDAEILETRPWLEGHPHLARPNDAANHIYVATERLSIPGLTHLPGAGTFGRLAPGRVLTAPEQSSRSLWALPAFFHPEAGTRLSYHEDPERWARLGPKALLRSAARGQEFVLSARASSVLPWLRRSIFADQPGLGSPARLFPTA